LGIFLGISISLAHFFPVVLILILTIISFSSLGIMSAGFIIIFKRGDPINWLFSTVSFLLGGVYYPVSILPPALQKLARLLPITHSLEGIRIALLTDSPLSSLLPSIFALLIFSVVLLPSSILLFRHAIKKAKIDGSLVQY
ncbi:MAG: ABC transporter permease, partial [Bacteroidales bacterium]|nr:ABC transporter permease [Bacteroidales bacterium]